LELVFGHFQVPLIIIVDRLLFDLGLREVLFELTLQLSDPLILDSKGVLLNGLGGQESVFFLFY